MTEPTAGLEARLRAGCRCRSGRVTRRTAASYGWWRTSYMPIGWRPSRPAADAPPADVRNVSYAIRLGPIGDQIVTSFRWPTAAREPDGPV
jgi:hypothetical protein